MPPSRKYTSAAEMKKKIDEYFAMQEADVKEYVNEKTGIPVYFKRPAYYGRLLEHLDLTYEGVSLYEDGNYDDENNMFSELLTYARRKCENDLAEGSMMGFYNPKVTEAALQRHHQFATKYEVKTDAKQRDLVDISAEIAELIKDKTDNG